MGFRVNFNELIFNSSALIFLIPIYWNIFLVNFYQISNLYPKETSANIGGVYANFLFNSKLDDLCFESSYCYQFPVADIRRPSAIQILLNLLKRRKEQDIVFALALDLTPKGRVVFRDDAVKTKALASLTLENFE